MKRLKNCKDVSKIFINSLAKDSQSYDEVRIVFDDYYDVSLKNKVEEISLHRIDSSYLIE